jgi:hypothetical protein
VSASTKPAPRGPQRTRCAAARATVVQPPTDSFEPRYLIEARLSEALATLDLIFSGLVHSDRPDAELFLETLNPDTLSAALRGAMRRIREAQQVLEQLHALRQHQAQERQEGRP